jgi:O-antigen ligase
LFLFGLKKPVFAMAAFLVSLLTVNNYILAAPFGIEISLRVSLVLLIAVVVWMAFGLRGVKLGPSAKRIITLAVILVAITVIANLINTGWDWAFKDLRQTGAGLLIIILIPAVTRNLKDLKILCGVVFIGVAASATMAIMQHYHLLGMDTHTLVANFYTLDNRMPGMAEGPLDLAFVLLSVIPIVLCMYLAKGMQGRARWLLLIAVILMALGTYFTYTRSALLAVAVGIVALVPFLAKNVRVKLLLTLLIVVVLIILVGQAHDTRIVSTGDASAQSRDLLRQAGYNIIRDNPLWGIGAYKFPEVSRQYGAEIDPSIMQQVGEDLGTLQPHNDFVYIAACYGIPALIAFLGLIAAVFVSLRYSHLKTRRLFIKALSAGLIGGLVAYLVNAYYHNALISIPVLWVLIGFSLAVAKLTATDRKILGNSNGIVS